MNSNLILKTDILDIIFEKRNKAYGAYVLRKLYPGRLKYSLGIMLLVAAAFAGISLIPARKQGIEARVYAMDDNQLSKVEQKKEDLPKQEQPKPEVKQPQQPLQSSKLVSSFQIVKDSTQADSIVGITDKDIISNTTFRPAEPGISTPPVQPADPGPGVSAPAKPDRSVPIGLGEVDEPPTFPGGTEALLNFLRRHLNNPEPMTEGEFVNVKVSFVVGYEGKLQSFKITQDGGDVFNKEVIRVLKKMPDWIPGKAKGENVSVYYSIPVKFTGTD